MFWDKLSSEVTTHWSQLKKSVQRYFRSRERKLGKYLFDEILAKKKGIEHRANEIEVLALGDSYCMRGFNSDQIPNAYNLGFSGQDLYSSHYLFDKYIQSLPNLKHLIFFYSMHTGGHELSKTTFYKSIALGHYIFGIPYQVDWLKKWEKAAQKRMKDFNDEKIDYRTFSGYFSRIKVQETPPDVKERCAHHIRENKRPIRQDHHLFEMAENCQKRKIQLSVVIAPIRTDFQEELAKYKISDEELFHDIFAWAEKNEIPVLNVLRSKDFKNEDFIDCHHLSLSGAQKLTQKIKETILSPKNQKRTMSTEQTVPAPVHHQPSPQLSKEDSPKGPRRSFPIRPTNNPDR